MQPGLAQVVQPTDTTSPLKAWSKASSRQCLPGTGDVVSKAPSPATGKGVVAGTLSEAHAVEGSSSTPAASGLSGGLASDNVDVKNAGHTSPASAGASQRLEVDLAASSEAEDEPDLEERISEDSEVLLVAAEADAEQHGQKVGNTRQELGLGTTSLLGNDFA